MSEVVNSRNYATQEGAYRNKTVRVGFHLRFEGEGHSTLNGELIGVEKTNWGSDGRPRGGEVTVKAFEYVSGNGQLIRFEVKHPEGIFKNVSQLKSWSNANHSRWVNETDLPKMYSVTDVHHYDTGLGHRVNLFTDLYFADGF